MEVRTLTSQSPDLAKWLPELLRLSRKVFEPKLDAGEHNLPSKSPQLQIETWREKLALPDAAFFHVLRDEENPTDVELKPNILGFFFAHSRLLSGNLGSDPQYSYHVYLAAVHPSARSQGIFPLLLYAVKEFAKKTSYKTLTVATIPDKFPRMYSILCKKDSEWVLLEERKLVSKDGVVERKVLMGMSL